MSAHDISSRIAWRCDFCSGPVYPASGLARVPAATGYLAAPYAEITSGGPVHWIVAHDTCRPDTGDAYTIDVSRIPTPGKARTWTAHLAAKTWHARSDWPDVLARHGLTPPGQPAPATAGTSGAAL